MSNGWDRQEEKWTKAARKGPYTLLFKILGTLVIVGLIFGAYGLVCGTAREVRMVQGRGCPVREEAGRSKSLQGEEVYGQL